MIVLITGTPGTGKSTISRMLKEKLGATLVDVNKVVIEEHLYTGVDKDRGYKVVDLDAMCIKLDEITETFEGDTMIVEGHLSHYFKGADLVIVLRARPDVLRKRLKARGWNDSKINENVEAEALDTCTFEANEIYGEKVNEVDTSELEPEEVSDLLVDVITGKKHFPIGNVDFLEDIIL